MALSPSPLPTSRWFTTRCCESCGRELAPLCPEATGITIYWSQQSLDRFRPPWDGTSIAALSGKVRPCSIPLSRITRVVMETKGPRLQLCNTFSWQMDGCLLPIRTACTGWQSRRLLPGSNPPGRNKPFARLFENLRNTILRYLFCAASLPTAFYPPKLPKQGVTSDVIH